MKISLQQLAAALDSVSENISKSDSEFEDYSHTGDDWAKDSAGWHLHLAYMQLSTICEVLELPQMRAEVTGALQDAQKDGLLKGGRTPDGEPYLKWSGPVRRFRLALQSVLTTESTQTVTKDLVSILRESTYAITDRRAFGTPPSGEDSFHYRIEALLRCVFPDLRHKPKLTKPIKNFEPDTGIASIETLIEYKFIDHASQVPLIADQILADTRGYTSKDWRSFVYVIYETERFKPESEWRQLLRDCEVPTNTSVVVLTGSPPAKRRLKQSAKRTDPRKNKRGAA